MSNQHDRDDFRYLTYAAGKHSCPKALVTSFRVGKPARVLPSVRGKGPYFPRTCNDQVRYQYDGLHVVIHIREKMVFYLVRQFPRRMPGHMLFEHPSFLEVMSHIYVENGHGINSDLTTEEVCCIAPHLTSTSFVIGTCIAELGTKLL
jgi:hypothetical protein